MSTGCDHCWAADLTHKRRHVLPLRYGGLTSHTGLHARFNGQVRFMPKDLAKILGTGIAQVWSVWNDLAHEGITFDQMALAFGCMMAAPSHRIVVCTKRPDRLAQFFAEYSPTQCFQMCLEDETEINPKTHRTLGEKYARNHPMLKDLPMRWPLPNVVLMTSAENQEQAVARIPSLLMSPAACHAVGCAPLLEPVDLTPWADRLGWIVAEEESGSGRRHVDRTAFEALRDLCQEHDIPFLLKQMTYQAMLYKLPPLDGVVFDQFPDLPNDVLTGSGVREKTDDK